MQDHTTKFQVEFFSCILDETLQSLDMFLLLQQHFKFPYNIISLRSKSKEHFMKHGVDL
jgi:hypothetical protein